MKQQKIVILSAILILGTSITANADNTHDPRVNLRQDVQKLRIIDGVRSGELTKLETRKLRRQQKGINKLERKFKSDGHLSLRERKKLNKVQNKASKSIYKKKHNRRSR